MAKTDSTVLVKTIEDALLRLNLSMNDCRGQCYDGASNMAGHISGVQAQIRQKCQKALFLHCCAHSLNLVVQDSTRCVSLIRDVLDFVKDLNTVIRASAKRFAIFQTIQAGLCSSDSDSDGMHVTSSPTLLRPLCPTRWTVRAESMQSVVDNYRVIMLTLDTISSTDQSESGSKAAGLFRTFHCFSTYFGLKLGISVFERAEKLSKLLQSKHLTASAAKQAAADVIKSFNSDRSDIQYANFWSSATSEAKALDVDEPILPRRQRPSVLIDCGSEGVVYGSPMD